MDDPPHPVVAKHPHVMTGSSVTVIDGEVTFDGASTTWAIVKVRDAAHDDPQLHAGWPHVGFIVASDNGWRVNVTLRKDGLGGPGEGTPSEPRVLIAPFDMDELAAVGPLLMSMRSFRIDSRVVDAACLPALIDEVAARPAPPAELLSALATHRAPKVARSLSHLRPPTVT